MRYRRGHGCEHRCPTGTNYCEEEMLETIWTAKEEGKTSRESILKRATIPDPELILEQLENEGMIEVGPEEVLLSQKGEKRARKVIRQHRLAEVLLHQVMNLDEEVVENAACQFEHMLNPEVTESICTLLGHPRTCPHGKPIPPARCCERYRTEVQPLVQRLSDLAIGQSGRITVIAPKFRSRLDRLGTFGVVPGAEVKLLRKFPSYVIGIGETTIAVDQDIAGEIFVRLMGSSSGK